MLGREVLWHDLPYLLMSKPQSSVFFSLLTRLRKCPRDRIIDVFFVFQIGWMQIREDSDENRSEIVSKMDLTFNDRKNYILKESPQAWEVFQKYPKLSSYRGAMVRVPTPNVRRSDVLSYR